MSCGASCTQGFPSTAATSDHKVAVDGADTTPNFLSPKLAAGAGITLTVLNPGGNEQVQITASVTSSATPTRSNKNMVASVTAADGDLACATAVAFTPAASSAQGGYIGVPVNGLGIAVGDGTKVAVPCYFSGDGGITARALRSVVAGDLLYWNRTVALFDLAATDRIDFLYPVTS